MCFVSCCRFWLISYLCFYCVYIYFLFFFFFSSRRRHTRCGRDWSSDVCSSDLRQQRRHPLGAAGDGDHLVAGAIPDGRRRQLHYAYDLPHHPRRRRGPGLLGGDARSEERRVGKECGMRGAEEEGKEKRTAKWDA